MLYNTEPLINYFQENFNIKPTENQIEDLLKISTTLKFNVSNDKQIIDTFCSNIGVSYSEISSKSRKRELVYIRYLLMYILRQNNLSFEKIGHILKRDHATILSGLRRFEILKEGEYEDIQKLILKAGVQI